MLLRLDVYPDGCHEPSETSHVCLSTIREDETDGDDDLGALVRVGRKAGTASFPTDRSVSRQHCLVRCVYKADDCEYALAPRNEGETKACEENAEFNHMCLVLENFGKGGSYIAVDDVAGSDAPQPKVEEDLDEDTDEEGVSQRPMEIEKIKSMSQKTGVTTKTGASTNTLDDMPELSAATQHVWNSETGNSPTEEDKKKRARLIKLDAGESRVLSVTRLMNGDIRPIMIQCGRFGSTIGITVIPLRFAFSRVSKAKGNEIRRSLPLIGAVAEPDDLPRRNITTHLVTPERIAGAKQLIAWCLQLPLVTPDFVTALQSRSSAKDDMPDATGDYEAPVRDKNTFWTDVKPNPKLLSRCTLLSVDPALSDMERLAEAGGSRIINLHNEDLSSEEIITRVESLLDADPKSKQGYFTVYSRKKIGKQIGELGVPIVTPKLLAASISRQEPLKDGNGEIIGVVPDDALETVEEGNEEEEEARKENEAVDDAKEILESPKSSNAVENKKNSRGKKEASPDEAPSQGQSVTPKKNEKQRDVEPVEVSSAEKIIPEEQRSSPDKQGSVSPGMPPPSDSSGRQKKRNRIVSSIDPIKETPANVDPPRQPEHVSPVVTKMKPKPKMRIEPNRNGLGGPDSNGWFAAAPKDNATRKAWRRKANERYAEENGGVDLPLAARTESLGYKVAAVTTIQENVGAVARAARVDGVNFKRFRKNVVPPPATLRIALHAVLPKQSDQMDEQADTQIRQIEEEQRLADALFLEQGDGTMRQKRRRRI